MREPFVMFRPLAVAVLLLTPAAVSADSGPFPLCDASGELFCIGAIDFTSLVVTTDPPHATSDEPTALRIKAWEPEAGSPCHGDHRWSRRPTIAGRTIVFEVQPSVADCPPPPPDPRPKRPVERSWDLGLLPAGVYTVQLRWDGLATWAESRFEVHFPNQL